MAYAQLPKYEYNAMIDFSPIGTGAQAIQKGATVAYDRQNKEDFGNAMAAGDIKGAMAAGALIDPKLALESGRYSMESALQPGKVEAQGQQLEKTTRELLGAHAQTLSEIKDPTERATALNRWVDSSPKVAAGLTKLGVDWKTNPDFAIKSIYQDALGAQDPEQQKKIAAETARALIMPAASGTDLVQIPQPGQPAQTIHTTGAKLNPDYEYLDPANPQAGVRPRPGGNADTKQLEKQQAARSNLDATNQNLDLLISNIRELHSPTVTDEKGNVIEPERTHPGLGGNYGLSGKVFNMPGGEAANAYAKLEQLRARGGFEALSAMRQASKTGGALGSVSDAEGKQLQNSFAALQGAQGEENVKRELAKTLKQVELSKQRINEAYRRQYSNPGPTGSGEPAQYSGSQGQNGPAAGPRVDKPNTGRLPPSDGVERKVLNGKSYVKQNGQWFAE